MALVDDVEVEVERVDLDVGEAGLRGQGLGDLDVARDPELPAPPARR